MSNDKPDNKSELKALKASEKIFKSRIKNLEKELEDTKFRYSVLSSRIRELSGESNGSGR